MTITSYSKVSKLPQIPNKRYFTIGEVGFLCGVKPYVLRYWEQEFPQLRPSKRRGNRRYYQREDVVMVRNIRGLLYDEGYTISGARVQLDLIIKQNKQSMPQEDQLARTEQAYNQPSSNNLTSNNLTSNNLDFTDLAYLSKELQEISNSLKSGGTESNNNINNNKTNPNFDFKQEYCTTTELEYLANQLKSEQFTDSDESYDQSYNNNQIQEPETFDFSLADELQDNKSNRSNQSKKSKNHKSVVADIMYELGDILVELENLQEPVQIA